MIAVSLLLNVAVLIPVSVSLIADLEWTRAAYGDRTPARDILLAVYVAILLVSTALLVGTLAMPSPALTGAVAALLGIQIAYKVMTAFTVRSAARNAVVLSNLGIAAVRLATAVTLFASAVAVS